MSSKLRFVGLMFTGMAIVLYVVFLVPPLTSGGGTLMPGVTEAELVEAIRTARAYCDANVPDVDCGCFSSKAGLVKAAEAPRVPGIRYADQTDLARSQALSSC